MKHTYIINGMTCGGCKASVEKHLIAIKNIINVHVDLEKKEAEISMKTMIPVETLQNTLPEKFTLTKKQETNFTISPNTQTVIQDKSKLAQLKPLFLILLYISSASILLHYKSWNWKEAMVDFMGLFYIVFSFFKMLDLKGFAKSFSMYDPLAKRISLYSKVYPFMETLLGLLFLFRFQINIGLIATIIILGITTIGVTQTLLNKKTIQCACLGTALKLPMTEATFIENTLMIIMALIMFF